MLKGKKIIIGVTGSIAAYKIPFLIRLLKKEGAEVRVILTPYAHEFVTPLTLSTLSEQPVLTDFYEKATGSWHSHIELGLWADLILIAPLSANTMAKMATGIADNLLLTTILSARCPIYYAPAMDLDMYKHPTTRANIQALNSFGYRLIEPREGELASGLKGVGRLEEPEQILALLRKALEKKTSLEGQHALVSAGPTFEPIDPVRYIGNYSTGKMGIAIATVLAERGATVDLVLGPVGSSPNHPAINIHPVRTAAEMYEHCIALFPKAQIGVMSAAVADFRPSTKVKDKIKKEQGLEQIMLEPTKDILAEMGKIKRNDQVLVGFALETENEEMNARKKLKNKNLDIVVLNSLNDPGAGFGHDTNKVSLFDKQGKRSDFPLKSKTEVAGLILDAIEGLIK